jgi:integrase
MARPGGVWWNKAKQAWYATVQGRKVRLASAEEGKARAEERWHAHKAKDNAPKLQDDNTCETVFRLYLDHVQANHATSYPTHRGALKSFIDCHGKKVKVRDVRASHVERWFKAHPNWADGTKHTNATVVVTALNWAAKPEQRIITSNPIRGLHRPPTHSRGAEVMISAEDHTRLLAVANAETRDMLTALRQTGMRPASLGKITAEDCDLARGVISLSKHKTGRKTGRPLLIPMSTPMLALCRRLCAEHPEGPIFLTRRRRPWTGHHIKEVMQRLRKKAGLSDKIVAYGYRHSVATELLEAGTPDAKVAAILGHKDTKMIYHHYSHLGSRIRSLASEIDRVINQSASPDEGASQPG